MIDNSTRKGGKVSNIWATSSSCFLPLHTNVYYDNVHSPFLSLCFLLFIVDHFQHLRGEHGESWGSLWSLCITVVGTRVRKEPRGHLAWVSWKGKWKKRLTLFVCVHTKLDSSIVWKNLLYKVTSLIRTPNIVSPS